MNIVVIDGSNGDLVSKIDCYLDDPELSSGVNFHFFTDVVESMQNIADLDPGLIICDYKLESTFTGSSYTGDDVFEYLASEIGMDGRGMIFSASEGEGCESRRNLNVHLYYREYLALPALRRIKHEAIKQRSRELNLGLK